MGTDKDTHTDIIDFNITNRANDFIIRRCAFDDLELVKEVNEKELPEDYPFFFYKSILDNFPEAFLIACMKDDPEKIIGYVMWRVEKTPSKHSLRLISKGHLVSIAVLKSCQRKGAASALLAKSMYAIKKHNLKEYVLEVRISNYSAINLYAKFNYMTEGIKKKYYKDGENAYYMVCKAENL